MNDRSLGIDCLRGVAILWVLFYHFVPLTIFNRGTFGVLLFFIISGYCISFSAETSRSAWHFYSKRLGRLLPALIVCGFLTVAFKHLATPPIDLVRPVPWTDYVYTLFALPTLNILRRDYFPPDGAYWSLQVEFQFYVVCLLIMAIGLKRHLLPILCAFVIFRTATSSLDQVSSNDFFPFFIAGVSVAAAIEGRRNDAIVGLCVAIGVDLYHLWFHFLQPSAPIESVRSMFLWVGTAAVYMAARNELKTAGPRQWLAPLAFIGVISYPLYLIHQDVGQMLFALFDIPRSKESAALAFRMIAAPAFFIIVAALIHRYVERPSMARLSAFLADPFKVRRQRQASALPIEA